MIGAQSDDRIRRPRKGSGSHNRSSAKNAEYGRKGGKAKVPKGFAMLESAELKKVTSKGVKARAEIFARKNKITL